MRLRCQCLPVVVCMLLVAVPALGQVMKVSDLGREVNNVVTVEGFVTQYQEDPATTRVFHIKDDWAGIVMIRTSDPVPRVGARLRVTGTVTIDPKLNSPSIIEKSRVVVSDPGAPPPPPPPVYTETEAAGETNYLLYLLIAATVIVLGALVVVIVRMVGKGKAEAEPIAAPSGAPFAPSPTGGPSQVPDGATIQMPKPQEIIEGHTIKMHAPPPGTLKLLPGFFEVAAGEPQLKEIRLYKTSGQTEIETTIGRNPGEPYKHIQLKLPTVSRQQAKLVFSNGRYTLINYAPDSSNPTEVNGSPMGVNESRILEEGDRIRMGELELVYHVR
ncbi:FHA domain-containing protein [Candidatus Fermentibacteria bacterium]|nr:FHA domain-containing protein [Candidatus Fermentibacteria bacterium]